MATEIAWWAASVIAGGVVTGVLAGLFGIGGGAVIEIGTPRTGRGCYHVSLSAGVHSVIAPRCLPGASLSLGCSGALKRTSTATVQRGGSGRRLANPPDSAC